MRKFFLMLLCYVFLVSPLAFAANSEGVNLKPKTPEDWRSYLRYRRDQTLEELYRIKPEAKLVVERAQGYAVFTNFSLKILLAGTGNGRGLVHDNQTGKETFMRMFQAGVGWGAGVRDFRAVFIFDDRQVMDSFINSGWSFAGAADAAATVEDKGGVSTSGAIEVAPGVRVYQLTKSGLALSAMVNGTKYWVDKDMNSK